jgi:[histone H3]-lysine4 N-trimethyltransferase ATXR3
MCLFLVCSALISSLEARASPEAVAAALTAVRITCGHNIKMLFDSGNEQHANATTAMLDTINKICSPLGGTNNAVINGNGNGASIKNYDDDSEYFAPPEALNDILTISVDPNLLASRPKEEASNGRGRPVTRAGDSSGGGRGRGGGGARGRGRGSQSIGEKRRNMPIKIFTHELQNQIATALHLVLQPDIPIGGEEADGDGGGDLEDAATAMETASRKLRPVSPDSLPFLLMAFVDELSNSGASASMRSMGATLPRVISTLRAGKFLEPEEMVGSIGEEAHAIAENYLTTQNPDVRRGKIIGQADAFVNLVGELMDRVIGELLRVAKAKRMKMPESELLAEELAERAVYEAEAAALQAAAATANALEVQRLVRVPLSIQANREPYRNGDWRKTPFVPRPYTRLQKYDIVEEATRKTIEKKLSTKKRGGCNGEHCREREHLGTYSLEAERFITECSCLSRNTECDETCGCSSTGPQACLNRAVTVRQTVKIDEDVEEINSWGMDCYTRRNIQDAVLESQAFGAYDMPDFKHILRQIKAGVPPARIAATAAGQHAAVAADSPAAGAGLVEGVVAGVAAAPSRPASAGQRTSSRGGSRGGSAASGGGKQGASGSRGGSAAGMNSPTTTTNAKPTKAAVERAVVEWIERTLVPAINRQGPNGWDLRAGLAEVKSRAVAANDSASLAAADAVDARLELVGYNYFRIHPKGVGLVCRRPGGLPRLTFVEEYLGEIHTPHRWFELQDAVKKITGDELPDFYNITLERPRDDPDGYDILFVDAAAKGAFASRMSHSCTPNCQAVVMACGGRLTIALYTLRHVHEGEELTFDYSSVTESEKEFRDAICLCGTHMCRGSYLYFTGSRAFMQVMTRKHNMLHRNVILCRAGMEPVTQADKERLKKYGIGESCLGSVEKGDRAEPWLEKWAALICEYLDTEEACLKDELLNRDPYKSYTEATAAAEAKGVVANRVQNIAITLDKVRMFLSQPGQPKDPVLRPLSDDSIIDHLWRGPKSVAKKLLKGAVNTLGGASTQQVRSLSVATDEEMFDDALNQIKPKLAPSAVKLCEIGMLEAHTVVDARKNLQLFVDQLRVVDVEIGGGLTAAADIGQMYVLTQHWMTSVNGFKSFMSNPVPINLQDLFLNREAAAAAEKTTVPVAGSSQPAVGGGNGEGLEPQPMVVVGGERQQQPPVEDAGNAIAVIPQAVEEPNAMTTAAAIIAAANASAAAPPPVRTPEEEAAAAEAAIRHANALARKHKNHPALRKQYRPLYLWGQLNGWFKQTVNDPTASLSAERRGTISLPDIESCFGGTAGTNSVYGGRQRYEMLEHIEKRPDGMWKTGTQWSFRNENKIYGSPMLDAAWGELTGEGDGSWRELVKALKEAALPFEMPTRPSRTGGGGRGRGRGRRGRGGGGASAAAGAGRTGRPRGRPSRRAAAVAAEEGGFGTLMDDVYDDIMLM